MLLGRLILDEAAGARLGTVGDGRELGMRGLWRALEWLVRGRETK